MNEDLDARLRREWIVTNGLGGYASGTVANVPTRRYHGPLIAATAGPLGRVVMLNHLIERVGLPDGSQLRLGGFEHPDGMEPDIAVPADFRLDAHGLPVWRYDLVVGVIEKTLFLSHGENTVHILYRLTAGAGAIGFQLHPWIHVRPHDSTVDGLDWRKYAVSQPGENRFEVSSGDPDLPKLRLFLQGASWTLPSIRHGHRTTPDSLPHGSRTRL